jgi:hypothetical protein
LGDEPTDSAIEHQFNKEFEKKANNESNDEEPPSLKKEKAVSREGSAHGTEDEKETKDDDAWKAYWAND